MPARRDWGKPKSAGLRNPNQRARPGDSVTVDGGKEPWTVVEIIAGHITCLKLSSGERQVTVQARHCDKYRKRGGDSSDG